jgi:hypothetical protein
VRKLQNSLLAHQCLSFIFMPDFTGEEGLGPGLAVMGTERCNSFGVVGGGACTQGRLVGLATLGWMIITLRVFETMVPMSSPVRLDG